MKVALIEKDALGGTCLNRGCIPTKSLLNASKRYKHALESAAMGIKSSAVEFDLPTAMAWKNQTVTRLVGNVEFLMKKNKVDVINGTGTISSPNTITIQESGQMLEGRHLIIATGSVPSRPPIPGSMDNPVVMTSDEVLNIAIMPKSVVVIGGGVIGIEFASFFSALGVQVTVIEMLPEILPFMDGEIASVFKRGLKGVAIETGAAVSKIEGGTVFYKKGEIESSAAGEIVLMATGRRPALSGIGLEAAGIKYSPRGIETDDSCRTNIPTVWAIGDATGRSLLAHSASAMGRVVVDLIAGKEAAVPWNALPWVVYGEPEAAGVGITEAEAKSCGIDYVKSSLPARANGRFLAENGINAHGICKIIAEKASGRILGAHLVSPYAGEIIWGMQYALMRGATAHELESLVIPHPTLSELLHDALGGLAL